MPNPEFEVQCAGRDSKSNQHTTKGQVLSAKISVSIASSRSPESGTLHTDVGRGDWVFE